MSNMHKATVIGASIAILVFTASCDNKSSKSQAHETADVQPTPPAPNAMHAGANAPNVPTAQLLAAAEPFETLTETAFSATPAALDASVQKAKMSATSVRASLPASAMAQFDAHLAALTAAHAKMDRAGVALSSIEVYRDLVSAAPNGAKVPSQVNLLDYAGFRYDADLKATPSRWDDMTQAVVFAKKNWAEIAPRVNDAALAGKVVAAINAMDRAAAQKNSAAAAHSAKVELDLIDMLEQYFKTH